MLVRAAEMIFGAVHIKVIRAPHPVFPFPSHYPISKQAIKIPESMTPTPTKIPTPSKVSRIPRPSQIPNRSNTQSRIPVGRLISNTPIGESKIPRTKSATGARTRTPIKSPSSTTASRRPAILKRTTPKPFRCAEGGSTPSRKVTTPKPFRCAGVGTAATAAHKRRLSATVGAVNPRLGKSADRRVSVLAGSNVVRPVSRKGPKDTQPLNTKKYGDKNSIGSDSQRPGIGTNRALLKSPRVSLTRGPSILESYRAARRASLAKAGGTAFRADTAQAPGQKTESSAPVQASQDSNEVIPPPSADISAPTDLVQNSDSLPQESSQRKAIPRRRSNRFSLKANTDGIERLRRSLGPRRTSITRPDGTVFMPDPPMLTSERHKRNSLKVKQVVEDGEIPGSADNDMLA